MPSYPPTLADRLSRRRSDAPARENRAWSLDALIAAQSEKLGGLQDHKKGLMQQLFPSPEGD